MAKLRIRREDFILALVSDFDLAGAARDLDSDTSALLRASPGLPDERATEDPAENPRYRAIDTIGSHDSFRIMYPLWRDTAPSGPNPLAQPTE